MEYEAGAAHGVRLTEKEQLKIKSLYFKLIIVSRLMRNGKNNEFAF